MSTEPIANLREKIDLVKLLLNLQHDYQFAALIKKEQNTLAGYFHDRGKYAVNQVPMIAVRQMARVLCDALDNRISIERSLSLWAGPFSDFKTACLLTSATRFRITVSRARRAKMITVHISSGRTLRELIEFNDEHDEGSLRAQVGDCFYLTCIGPIDHWAVLLIESPEGFQLGCPRNREVVKFPEDGKIRIPVGRNWTFSTKGMHRFLLFAIHGIDRPTVYELDKPLSSLSGLERNEFADQLEDRQRTHAWVMDEVQIFVDGPGEK